METSKPMKSASTVYVCDVEALDNNEILQFKPADRPPIALYRVGNEFYATDDTCTHGDASLSDGEVTEEHIVHCPWHNGAFDIRTGEACFFPCVVALKIYQVIIEEKKVYLALE